MCYGKNRTFQIPKEYTSPYSKINYVLRICQKLYADALLQRDQAARLKEENERLKREIGNLTHEQEELKKKKGILEEDNERLKKQVEQLTKTNYRYKVSLFDHGNLKKSTDEQTKKNKGGQVGHTDTNRESKEDLGSYAKKRIFLTHCVQCGSILHRVSGIREKQLIDIVLNPSVVKLMLEMERQWCSKCKREVSAADEQSLPFTEYGMNIFLLTLILVYRCHLSLGKVSMLYHLLFGLAIAKSSLNNMLKQAKNYLEGTYQELLAAIKSGEIQYSDETGWIVRGKSAWMWVSANEETIVYFAAESRGKGIAKEVVGGSSAFQMTDGYASYEEPIHAAKHGYCWAHLLRFAHEETVHDPPNSSAVQLREDLVTTYKLIHTRESYHPRDFYTLVKQQLLKLIARSGGEDRKSSHGAIRTRLLKQAEGLALSLTYTPNGTNNRAEQVLRGMAIKRTISFGSDTYTGMETTAVNASIVATLSERYGEKTRTHLQEALRQGISRKFPYYTFGKP